MLEELLKRSREAIGKRWAGDSSGGNSPTHWAIITCMSCPLNDYLQNLVRGDAVIIRNAGAAITPWDNGIIRSVAAAVYLIGVKEVAVIGHTNCQMKSDIAPLTDALARYGRSREILKDFDLREWFGLITTEEIAVRKTVDAIRQSPVIPQEIPVYGLMMDSATGELKEICRAPQASATVSAPSVPKEVPFKAAEVLPASSSKATDKWTPPPLPKQSVVGEPRGGRTGVRMSAEEKMKELRDRVRKMDRR